jgi:hypothetical protein
MNNDVFLSGILKHGCGGYGFKVTFKNKSEANKWKARFHKILVLKGYNVESCEAYYDTDA